MGIDLTNKYGIDFNIQDVNTNIQRLTNQVWKLIPMRENNEDWKRQLDNVLIEIVGLNEIFEGPSFLQALSKLEGIRVQETDFELYRKTVFETITYLQKLKK
jgi:hypothetical protein